MLPVLLLSVLALGACGSEGGGDAADDPTSPSPTSSSAPTSAAPSPLPTMTPPTAPPSTPSDTFQKVRLTGTVARVGGCVQLTDANGVTWELRGAEVEPLGEGDRVDVVGQALADDGTCGAPVAVRSVEAAAG